MTATSPIFRSYLYVPGTDPRLVDKALDSAADAVVIDLEDGVAATDKARARQVAAEAIAGRPGRAVFVRVNATSTDLAVEDIEAVAGTGVHGVRVPKVGGPDQIRTVAAWLEGAGAPAGTGIVPLIESALGVERCWEIASASTRIAGLAVGEADLRADLGVTSEEALLYARSRCVTAARAAGHVCVQSVYTNVRDLPGLRASTEQGRAMGFVGRSAIHPAQVEVIHEALAPSEEEVSAAQELLGAYRSDGAVAVAADGRFVDEAVLRSARLVLDLAERARPGSGGGGW